MPDLVLQPGEILWDENGRHVLDANTGKAVVCESETTVTIADQTAFDNANSRVLAARQIKTDANARKYQPPVEEE